MTRRVTATEAKAKMLALLNEVAAGGEVEITRHGRAVARLVPAGGPHALKGRLLARHERIVMTIPIRSWLEQLALQVRTVALSIPIADTASSLPTSFPGDAADRLIHATAIEHGWRLVTKDRRLRAHRHPRPLALW